MEAKKRVVRVMRKDDGTAVQRPTPLRVRDCPLPPIKSIDQLELVDTIGSTNLADVYKAIEKTTGRVVAVKALNKTRAKEQGLTEYFDKIWKKEIMVHRQLNHPYIVKLYDTFEDEDCVYLVMEFCEKGDFNVFFESRRGSLSESEVAYYIRQVALALDYLHRHDPVIIHRDVKAENCLISGDGSVKLADFGSAGLLYSPKDRRATICGTVDYLAPEIVKREGMDQKADVWALGVLAYELLVGTAPFFGESMEDTLSMIAQADFEMPGHLSAKCKEFIAWTLDRDEARRMTMEQACSHVFLYDAHPNLYFPLSAVKQLEELEKEEALERALRQN